MSSMQHKLDRVRRPRVQITYDVETNGAIQKVELPFVVGVLADLSGQPKEPLRPLKERQAVYIDRDNFDTVLEKAAPRLALRVDDKLTGGEGKLAVELNFRSLMGSSASLGCPDRSASTPMTKGSSVFCMAPLVSTS